MDVQKLAKWNKGHRYILPVVDVLSKYALPIPIKNKTGAVMVQALQTLWKPQRVQSDDGTEFMNAKVQAFLKKTPSRPFFHPRGYKSRFSGSVD